MERQFHNCSRCGQRKAHSEFYKAHCRTGWLDCEGHKRRSWCKECSKAADRQRWRNRSQGVSVSQMLQSARKRAVGKGIEFSLGVEDVTVPSHCPVLGIVLQPSPYGTRHPTDSSPTLDRIDNTRGYVPDNVIVVSWLANRIKNTATPEMLRQVAEFYQNLAGQRQEQTGVSEASVVYLKAVAGRA